MWMQIYAENAIGPVNLSTAVQKEITVSLNSNSYSMMKLKSLLILLCVICSTYCKSQDKVTFTNGRETYGKIISFDSSYVQMNIKKRKKESKQTIEAYRIFSITEESGKETILYRQDSLIGNFYNVPDMKLFVEGEKDAYNNFRPTFTRITGFCLGLGISLLDTYHYHNGMFKTEPGLIHLATPFLFPIIAGIPKVTFDVNKTSNRSYLMEPPYRHGYERVVKSKRVFAALKFSLAGSLTGLGMYYIGRSL